MKAAVLHGARDIRIEPYRQPELLPGMVLLRPTRVGICGTDLHYYEHGYNASFVPDRPFILGHELTAEVAAVAPGVDTRQGGPARDCKSSPRLRLLRLLQRRSDQSLPQDHHAGQRQHHPAHRRSTRGIRHRARRSMSSAA